MSQTDSFLKNVVSNEMSDLEVMKIKKTHISKIFTPHKIQWMISMNCKVEDLIKEIISFQEKN
jgi:hypothetical protein